MGGEEPLWIRLQFLQLKLKLLWEICTCCCRRRRRGRQRRRRIINKNKIYHTLKAVPLPLSLSLLIPSRSRVAHFVFMCHYTNIIFLLFFASSTLCFSGFFFSLSLFSSAVFAAFVFLPPAKRLGYKRSRTRFTRTRRGLLDAG